MILQYGGPTSLKEYCHIFDIHLDSIIRENRCGLERLLRRFFVRKRFLVIDNATNTFYLIIKHLKYGVYEGHFTGKIIYKELVPTVAYNIKTPNNNINKYHIFEKSLVTRFYREYYVDKPNLRFKPDQWLFLTNFRGAWGLNEYCKLNGIPITTSGTVSIRKSIFRRRKIYSIVTETDIYDIYQSRDGWFYRHKCYCLLGDYKILLLDRTV